MPAPRVKCETCVKTKKVTHQILAGMRRLGREEDARVGALCPDCVLRAYDSPEFYATELTDGEILVDQIRGRPPWRMVYIPK